jgi:GNAT superfamily N-acetyltransferase
MTDFRIRPFVPETDNVGILEVARALAIPARVQLGIDRSPDFTGFYRALDEPFEIVVAEARGRIVGFVEFCLGRFRVLGQETMGVHVPLGGVHPEWRGHGVFTAMRAEAFQQALSRGAQWGYVLVNARNRLMQENLRRSFPGLVSVNRLLVHGILLPWIPIGQRSDRSTRIGPLDEAARPELLHFMEERMRAYDIYPHVAASRWWSLPGCSATSHQIAKDGSGRIVASLGSWDPSAFKRALILRYGSLERALLKPVNWLLTRAGIQPFPKPGGPLRTLYALFPLAAPGYERALGHMIARLRKANRDYNAVLLAFPEGDPRNRLIRRYSHFSNVNIPFVIPLTRDFESEWRPRPPLTLHVEYAFA